MTHQLGVTLVCDSIRSGEQKHKSSESVQCIFRSWKEARASSTAFLANASSALVIFRIWSAFAHTPSWIRRNWKRLDHKFSQTIYLVFDFDDNKPFRRHTIWCNLCVLRTSACLCVHVQMCACILVDSWICMCMSVIVCSCGHMHLIVCMYVCVCLRGASVHVCMHVHVCIHACVCVCLCANASVRMCKCVHIDVYCLSMFMHDGCTST